MSSHAQKTGSWYFLGALFKISHEQSRLYYMKATPPPPPKKKQTNKKTKQNKTKQNKNKKNRALLGASIAKQDYKAITQHIIAIEYTKDLLLNYGQRCEDITDHRGYIHNLNSCEN